jgi:hypothetical protein
MDVDADDDERLEAIEAMRLLYCNRLAAAPGLSCYSTSARAGWGALPVPVSVTAAIRPNA